MLLNALAILGLGLGLTVSGLSLGSRQSGSGASIASSVVARGTSKGCNNTPTSRSCWGSGFDINTDTETSWPNTGHTVVVSGEALQE
jgi:hypothetical protein